MEGFDVVVEGDTFGGWIENVAPLADREAAGRPGGSRVGGTSSAAPTALRCTAASRGRAARLGAAQQA